LELEAGDVLLSQSHHPIWQLVGANSIILHCDFRTAEVHTVAIELNMCDGRQGFTDKDILCPAEMYQCIYSVLPEAARVDHGICGGL
jgi:hypothetical protein